MLAKIAWRNIWRNTRRSAIVMLSVIVGVVALIFTDGLTNGMIRQMLFNQISSNIAHVQIHGKGFFDNKIVQNLIPDKEKAEKALEENPEVKAYSERVVAYGLLSSATNSSGVYINGVNPEEESKVSIIKESIIEGNFLNEGEREIVLGKKLADKLDVGLGDKVVAMSNTPEGDIGSELFRISGIFETFSSDFDKSYIYIPIGTAQRMLNVGNKIHEIAVVLNEYQKAEDVQKIIKNELPDSYEVLSYQDILPLLLMQMDLYQELMLIINLIIGLALVFGIINSMLMAVFERINEFGVLMSIGMKNYKIFLMVIYEALFIGVIGTIAGTIFGVLIHIPLSIYGIDFSVFSESLSSLGVGSIIYSDISYTNLISLLVMIPVISVVGAIYPAYKAIKLEPVYAIRYV